MRRHASIAVIIPALDEEHAIGRVLSGIPAWVDDIVVVDNGSTDRTAEVVRERGARVVAEPRRGYGAACLAGIAALKRPDIVVFMDGDASDRGDEMARLVDPIIDGDADMVIGSRALGTRQAGAMTLPARLGTWLACALIRLFWRVRVTDLGPYRAIKYAALHGLHMRDRDYGWTAEMQVNAARRRLRVLEAPVSCDRRVGTSKVSGTLRGVIGAGTKILLTIFRAALNPRRLGDVPGHERLVVFSRCPVPGETKTRLIPVLGPEGAADLQRRMTAHTLRWAKQVARDRRASIEVRFEGGTADRMRQTFGADFDYGPQGDGDLGERILRTFEEARSTGAAAVVIVGTDCPELTARVAGRAFEALKRHDLVLGPATDGGYYVIGLRRPVPQLFDEVEWGTGEVLARTVRIAGDLGLSVALLEPLDDVDRPEDLPVWERARRRAEGRLAGARISVIIPTFNEAVAISTVISGAMRGRDVEIIVVDAGSDDGTAALARSLGVTVLTSTRNRGRQMNAGAAAATGDILLFLHGDTRLPDRFDEHVRLELARPGVSGGAFELGIDAPAPSLRFIERTVRWRSRRMQMPYGDQALFVTAEVFRRVGGMPELPLMEDIAFVRRLRRKGRVAITPATAMTSARRWLTLGVWRTTLINQVALAAYYLGVSPSRIARWYYRNR